MNLPGRRAYSSPVPRTTPQYRTDRLPLTAGVVEDIVGARTRGPQPAAPAAAYAVWDRDGVVHTGGFGSIDATLGGRAPTGSTAFRIASCTKSFTAATVLMLCDEGLLALQDPITAHLRIGPLRGADRPPTIGELLAMNGGLGTDDPWADRQESLRPSEFDDLLAAGIGFVRQPGTGYEYSNLGYALLGAAISRAAGADYRELVADRLLRPLGLTGLGFAAGDPAADTVATGFTRRADRWESEPFSAPGAFSSIGGMFATATDLARWCQTLAQRWPLMSVLRTPFSTDDPLSGYGYGLTVENDERHGPIAGHSGGYPGFGSHMRWHLASGIGVLVLENATYSGAVLPARRALSSILDHLEVPQTEPYLWPETRAARDAVERLLRGWDDVVAGRLLAGNVALDEPLADRRASFAELAGLAGIDATTPVADLLDCAPRSDTPDALEWTSPGRTGTVRCTIRLTPAIPPLVHTLEVSRG